MSQGTERYLEPQDTYSESEAAPAGHSHDAESRIGTINGTQATTPTGTDPDGDRERHARSGRRTAAGIIKYLLVLAGLGGVAALWYQAQSVESAVREEMRIPVRVVEPRRGPVKRTYQVGGHLESESMVTVLPRIAGSLNELVVDVGERVREGELIARIDDEPYVLTLRQAEAAYLSAKSTFERTEQLYESNATSRQNYEQAKGQYEATKSQFELARLNLAYTEIRAPVSGAVVQRHTSVGNLVGSQVPIVTIADLDNLEVKAAISERYYSSFAADPASIEVTVTIPALDGRRTVGEIVRVSPYVAPQTKSFEVTCALVDPPQLARPGMYVELTFALENRRDVLSVPNEALVGGTTLWYLEGEKARKLEIEPGLQTDTVTVVPDSLEGKSILIEGQHFLSDGQPVDVLE
jgi:RND family efflux transporter MFP subunit